MSITLDLEGEIGSVDEIIDVAVRALPLRGAPWWSSDFTSVPLEGNVSSDTLKRRSKPEFGVDVRCLSSTTSRVLFIA
jgi:hypothetical protein